MWKIRKVGIRYYELEDGEYRSTFAFSLPRDRLA
jgi:hypothetical protein